MNLTKNTYTTSIIEAQTLNMPSASAFTHFSIPNSLVDLCDLNIMTGRMIMV